MADRDGWQAMDDFICDSLIASDTVLDGALEANTAGGLPAIDVAPNQGKMLHLMARMCGAKRILEIGTLGGYSTIWLARALAPGGRMVTIEADPAHAAVARGNLARAGLGDVVDLRKGFALDVLPGLATQDPFDFIFVDADKPNNPNYLDWALKLSRSGTVLVFDNVVRNGQVADPDDPDPNVIGGRQLFAALGARAGVSVTAVQTVGSKGWDGFALAIVE